MAIGTTAAILGGASVLGGIFGGSQAKKAANAQADAARYAADIGDKQFQQTRTDMAPWREAGGKAIGQLSDMLQPGYDYTASPGYQFRLSEGLKGVEGSAASRGILHSGGTLKGINNYAQNMAAGDFGDQFNRVASVAAGGQQAATTLGQLGAQNARSAGDFATQAGNARASGYVGQANAFNGTLKNLTSLFG